MSPKPLRPITNYFFSDEDGNPSVLKGGPMKDAHRTNTNFWVDNADVIVRFSHMQILMRVLVHELLDCIGARISVLERRIDDLEAAVVSPDAPSDPSTGVDAAAAGDDDDDRRRT